MIAPLRIDIQRIPDRVGKTLDAKRTLRHAQSAASQQLAQRVLQTRNLPLDTLERRADRWIVHAASPLWLSISHAGPWVLCAHDTRHPCALDVERVDPTVDWNYAAKHFLHPQLKAVLDKPPTPQKQSVFTVLWTILEAQGKLLQTDLNATIAAPIFHDQKLRVANKRFDEHRAAARWLDDVHLCTMLCHGEHIPALIRDGWQRLERADDILQLSAFKTSFQTGSVCAQG